MTFHFKGNWRDTFHNHVLGLEHYLNAAGMARFQGERSVYLAGVIAREFDGSYLAEIEDYLLEDPDSVFELPENQSSVIGDSALILTVSRINAEHWTVHNANGGNDETEDKYQIPARFYRIASFYSHKAGKPSFGRLYGYLSNNCNKIVDLVSGYLEFVDEKAPDLPQFISSDIFNKFASEINEKEAKKDFLQQQAGGRGLDPARERQLKRMKWFNSQN